MIVVRKKGKQIKKKNLHNTRFALAGSFEKGLVTMRIRVVPMGLLWWKLRVQMIRLVHQCDLSFIVFFVIYDISNRWEFENA